ncbi:MAG: glycosyltransferase [Sulfuriferula multivorans]|uniref:Glycosyltransferase n=1 Tax=Sulfuriferula multivorans TaxID=1559896 RepID=A0A7C9P4T0_9PROT|nr:glycosyltransferase [Sulfuriferula multivorans]
MESSRKVVLLVAEAVTLAHYGRIATLARTLPANQYKVIVAADPRYRELDPIQGVDFHPIWSIPSSRFARALEQGTPLYDINTLMRYVEDDLALIDAVKPDLIVGDFRLSLAVSAPLRNVPYASVVNAYWSPYADIAYPVPDLPITRVMGLRVGQALFDLVRPFAFALHARPLNLARRRYGLPSLGNDLRVVYSWGNYTLYADVPELVPTRPLPSNHHCLGPPLWSARAPLPEWWGRMTEDKPVVLLTLGSSGRSDLLPMVLSALSDLPITVIAATAGKIDLVNVPENALVADYLPLDSVVQRTSLVICNGGSLMTYQALAFGVPVLGICSNMDQLLNMNAIQALGAGLSLRAESVMPAQLRESVMALLDSTDYAHAADQAGKRFKKVDVGQRFREFVEEVLG